MSSLEANNKSLARVKLGQVGTCEGYMMGVNLRERDEIEKGFVASEREGKFGQIIQFKNHVDTTHMVTSIAYAISIFTYNLLVFSLLICMVAISLAS